jgi:hypothetical protein
VPTLTSASRARLAEARSRRNWSAPGDHPIAALDGLRLGEYTVHAALGPKNAVGSRYFELFLANKAGDLAEEPLALGLHNSGPYPAFNWVELTQFREQLTFPAQRTRTSNLEPRTSTLDLWATGLEAELFAALSALVPPGGHIMAEYDSPSHKATERILTLRYPAAMSPIGYLLFGAGARSYRDWYISEGGREGPRKLQAFKPLNKAIATEKTSALRREVKAALAAPENPDHAEWGRLARELGAGVLRRL